MKKILTTALALAVISTSAIADETTANLYKNFYQGVNTYVDDTVSWKDTVLGYFADGYAHSKYGKQTIADSHWINKDVKDAWVQGYDGAGTRIDVYDWFNHNDDHGDFVAAIAGGESSVRGIRRWRTDPVYDRTDPLNPILITPGERHWETVNVPLVGVAAEAEVRKKSRRNLGLTKYDWKDTDVVNLSLGSERDYGNTHIHSIVDSQRNTIDSATGTIIVKAAGNESRRSEREIYNRTFTHESNPYKDSTLIVGAVHSDGSLASYSNSAGDLADSFVVDYGDLNLRVSNRRYVSEGTSLAAPRVSGKAAILRSKFTDLHSNQIVDIIKNTADDLGAPGVDEIYGHGRVNLSRALSPVGSLR